MAILLMASLSLWDFTDLKVTIEWVVGFALITALQIDRAEKESNFFTDILRDSVSMAALIAFIAWSYTFSLLVELLLTPILLILLFVAEFTGGKGRFESLHRITTAILALAGAAFLANSIYSILRDPRGYATAQTAHELLTPILLTVLFVPFLFALHLYVVYEKANMRVGHSIKDPELRAYARGLLMRTFFGDHVGLRNWLRHITIFCPQSRLEIDESLREIRATRKRLLHPSGENATDGWAPNVAQSFLGSFGLEAPDYHRLPDNWFASSPYMKLGATVLDNTIVYYMHGHQDAVTKLELVLAVNDITSADEAGATFQAIISALVMAAIPKALADNAQFELTANEPPIQFYDHTIALMKSQWTMRGVQSYEVTFTIDATPLGESSR